MRNIKLCVLIILNLSFLFLCSLTVSGATDDAFLQEAKELEKSGIIKGDKDGDLMLDTELQKQDLVIILSRLYGEESKAKTSTHKIEFLDTDKSAYYFPYICWAVEKGLVDGISDKKFGVGNSVTLKEVETIMLRILGYDEEAKNWDLIESLSDTIGLAQDLDIASPDKLTRGQIFKIISNALDIERKGSTLKLKSALNIL